MCETIIFVPRWYLGYGAAGFREQGLAMFKNPINRKKAIKLLVVGLLLIYMLTILINSQAIYKPFLMVLNLSLMVVAPYCIVKSEEMKYRYFRRWSKVRERGFRVGVAIESLMIFACMVILVALGKMVDWVTLTELRLKWSGYDSALIATMYLMFSVLIGFVSWHENEKRYKEYMKR